MSYEYLPCSGVLSDRAESFYRPILWLLIILIDTVLYQNFNP